jgi:hypothetical protein
MRIVCLIAVAVLLAGLGTLPAPRTAGAAASASTVTPAALINLGAIFGDDENEPDENETDGGEQQQEPTRERPALGSRISLVVVLAIAVLGVLAAAFVVNRLRRLWARVRGASARASARARGWADRSSWPRL